MAEPKDAWSSGAREAPAASIFNHLPVRTTKFRGLGFATASDRLCRLSYHVADFRI
jgi:hypothetical protein